MKLLLILLLILFCSTDKLVYEKNKNSFIRYNVYNYKNKIDLYYRPMKCIKNINYYSNVPFIYLGILNGNVTFIGRSPLPIGNARNVFRINKNIKNGVTELRNYDCLKCIYVNNPNDMEDLYCAHLKFYFPNENRYKKCKKIKIVPADSINVC